LEFCADRLIVADMVTIVSAMVSLVSFRFRRRASLELEVLALRHQVAVLHRQRPGRLWLRQGDRLLWAWLYRIWPRCLEVMVLVKPATVLQWHRQGFRKYWRWRSSSRRAGRPGVNREIRELIRQMSIANPLWGAPRIHGELLKLGIEVSQATVGRHMVRRHSPPSSTWRTFLRNQIDGIAAIDMFVVVTAAFRLLYVSVILGHARRKILHLNVTQHPTAGYGLRLHQRNDLYWIYNLVDGRIGGQLDKIAPIYAETPGLFDNPEDWEEK
jgi:putative transposase